MTTSDALPLAVPPSLLPDRRNSYRVATNDPARALVLGQHARPFDARVIDVSKNGIRIAMDRPVPVGGLVHVRLERLVILGEIRHCSMRDLDSECTEDFQAGILIHLLRRS